MELQDLLILKDIHSEDALERRFEEIAKLLFAGYHIRKGEDRYDFLEIEFYYYAKWHKDIITYPRNTKAGKWFFHASGVDITFESECENCEEEIVENDCFGGILIRSLLKNGTEPIPGPQKCTWRLFDLFDAFAGPNKEEWPFIIKNSSIKECQITKTQRWIPYKEETLENRFGCNVDSFKEFLDKKYRFFTEWPLPKGMPAYGARPWGREKQTYEALS